jgi:hypothetical protein
MEMTSYIHRILKSRSKQANWPYLGSIVMKNDNIPLFEEYFGQLDYGWLLEATLTRECKEVEPCVIRYVDDKNLSLNPTYRKRDFYMGLLDVDGNIPVMKRWYSSRARYHYIKNDVKMARFFFIRGELAWKTVLYYLTTYRVFG